MESHLLVVDYTLRYTVRARTAVLLAEAGRRECESAADVLSSETAESMVGQRSRGCALLHAAAFADSQDPGCKRPVQITAGKPLVNATTAPRALP